MESGVDTHSQSHTLDCGRPEMFSQDGPHNSSPYLYHPHSQTATVAEQGCWAGMSLRALNSSSIFSKGCQNPMPTGPAHPPLPQEVPALSTPSCIGRHSHLPAGVGLRVVHHQLQGLPLMGLNECEEVFRLGETQGLSAAPSIGLEASNETHLPTSLQGAWKHAHHGFFTSWRIWSEPTT